MTTNTVLSIYDSSSVRWLQYLTIWSWLLCYVYYILVTISSIKYYYSSRSYRNGNDDGFVVPSDGDPMLYSQIDATRVENDATTPNFDNDSNNDNTSNINDTRTLPSKFAILLWVLFETSLCVSFAVMIMYWGFVERPSDLQTPLRAFTTVNEHCMNFIILLTDFTLHRIPVRILHVVYPVTFGLCYVVFSVVYAYAAGVVVYDILDWLHRPVLAVGCVVGVMLLMVVVHVVVYVAHRVKIKCKGRNRVAPLDVLVSPS